MKRNEATEEPFQREEHNRLWAWGMEGRPEATQESVLWWELRLQGVGRVSLQILIAGDKV